MTIHDFIFTKAAPEKYYRHIVFWISRILLQSFGVGYLLTTKPLWGFFLEQISYRTVVIFLEIIFTYPVVYYFIPAYFNQKKYLKFTLLTVALALFTYCIFCFYVLGGNHQPFDRKIVLLWSYSMHFISDTILAGCTIFLTLKILKDYYRKMEEKATLAKENAEAELQMLKAQVHPHFLFNTLNNIYSFILNKSTQAEILVKKLTDVFQYMANETDNAMVPLENELKILQDYIELEKARYGSRLHMSLNIDGNPSHKMISPLLMIPFVENSFKHGTSQMLNEPWIYMEIIISDHTLSFLLRNSKPQQNRYSNGKNGIGLENVKKRLQLIYPTEHKLTIESGDNIFSVKMLVPLVEKKAEDQDIKQKTNRQVDLQKLNHAI